MAKVVQKFEGISGRLFDTMEEAQEDDFKYKTLLVCESMNTTAPAELTVMNILISIKTQFGKLTKADLQKMIEVLDKEQQY